MKFIALLLRSFGKPVYFLVKAPSRIHSPLEVINVTPDVPNLSAEKNQGADYVLIGFRVKKPLSKSSPYTPLSEGDDMPVGTR